MPGELEGQQGDLMEEVPQVFDEDGVAVGGCLLDLGKDGVQLVPVCTVDRQTLGITTIEVELARYAHLKLVSVHAFNLLLLFLRPRLSLILHIKCVLQRPLSKWQWPTLELDCLLIGTQRVGFEESALPIASEAVIL